MAQGLGKPARLNSSQVKLLIYFIFELAIDMDDTFTLPS